MKRVLCVWLGLAGVLGAAGWSVWSNERILAVGRIVLLELAPVDPRSLLQGDFMELNYALNAALRQQQARTDGYAVLRLDARQVATLVRVQAALPALTVTGAPPAADEVVIRYRVRQHRLQIASNAFFFQEGREAAFRGARYGEFRVGRDGEPRLTALLDADLNRLGENRY
jgi:uncharacterized membrane-anchored protein